MVKRNPNEYSDPLDLPKEAVKAVLARSEMLFADWVSE